MRKAENLDFGANLSKALTSFIFQNEIGGQNIHTECIRTKRLSIKKKHFRRMKTEDDDETFDF